MVLDTKYEYVYTYIFFKICNYFSLHLSWFNCSLFSWVEAIALKKTSESAIDRRAFSDKELVSFRVPRGLRRLRCIVRDLSLNIRAQPQ